MRKYMKYIYIFSLLFLSFALAQQKEQGPVPNSKGGGGGFGIGITIDIGAIFNAIKNALKREDLPTYPTLEKKATNISSSGSTYTIDWVVYYANNTNTTQNGINITDGPVNTIIPGSLQQPTGWTGSLAGGNTLAQWTGNAPPINGYMSSPITTSSYASTFNITGAGDGFRAIPYRHVSSGNKLRIYFINHHLNPTATFRCIDATTGNNCPGFPKNLPKGDGSSKTSASGTYDEDYYIDSSGKLYYIVTSSDNEYGLGCYDLEADMQCGFYKLGTSTNTMSFVKGPWKVGNELYVVDGKRKLYCLNANNPSNFCTGLTQYFTGFTFPVGSFPDPSSSFMSWGPAVFGEVLGSKLYFITDSNPNLSYNAKTLKAFCFDSVTKAPCPGSWGISSYTTIPGSLGSSTNPQTAFIYYDTFLNPKHICVRLQNAFQYCFDLASGNTSSPPVLFSSINLNYSLSPEVKIGNRTYFADIWYAPKGRVLCWDWSTASPCAPTWEYKSWTNNPRDYAINVDDKGCIWILGDNAPSMWFFDPNKPTDKQGIAQKCGGNDGTFNTTFQPWNYCSGPKPFIWLQLQIANANVSDFSQLLVIVKDASNNTILTYDCVANNNLSVNLSSISSQTNGQPLNVEVKYSLVVSNNVQPELRAYYHASPLEFCYKSQHKCPQQEVKNAVSINLPDNPKAEVVVNLPSERCQIAENGPGNGSGNNQNNDSGNNSGNNAQNGSSQNTGVIGGSIGVIGGVVGSSGSSGVNQGGSQNGVILSEKSGKVEVMPEVIQRCYWRPKQKAKISEDNNLQDSNQNMSGNTGSKASSKKITHKPNKNVNKNTIALNKTQKTAQVKK
ncbi:MAG: hypothetical protein ACP5PT_07140, partial [Brevinematia bacterium]